MDTFLAIEHRCALFAGRDRLARANLYAGLRAAEFADFRLEEDHVIGVTGRCLYLAADKQRILVRDEQLSVEGNRRPAAGIHQYVMQGLVGFGCLLAMLLDFFVRELAAE